MRRVALVLVAAFAATGWAAPTAPARDVLNYQVDPGHSGFTPERLHLPLRRAWTRLLADHVSVPIVMSGRVFVTVLRGTRWRVVALDLRTGRRLWTHRARDMTAPRLAATAGRLVGVDRDGRAIGLDPRTGRRRWMLDLWSVMFFCSAPAADAGTLVFACSSVRDDGGGVAAVRASDGRLLWRGAGGTEQTPALADGRILLADHCAVAKAVAIGDGRTLWDAQHSCDGMAFAPVVAAGRLFVAGRQSIGEGNDLVLDPATGAVARRMDAEAPPAVGGGVVVAVAPGDSALRADDLATGAQRWRFPATGIVGPALIAGRHVLVGTRRGRLYVVGRGSGRMLQSVALGTPVEDRVSGTLDPGLAVADRTLLVPGRGRLIAYR